MATDPNLPDLIRSWREYAKLMPLDLANACEVSDAAVYYWEQGATTPTVRNLGRIATACGTTLAQFWAGPPRGRKRAS